MKTRYTYLGDSTIEVVMDGEEVQVNILPTQRVNITQSGTLSEDFVPESEPVQAPPLQAAPLQPTEGKTKPAAIRAMYTFFSALAGMFAAGLAYVQANMDTLMSSLNWTIVIAVVVGAAIAGLLYGLKKYFKPEGTW